MTDEQIRAIIRLYAVFGMGCAAVMALKTWLEDLKKPVIANCLAGLFFIAVSADVITQSLWYHTARSLGLGLPMAAIALCGAWCCARNLAKIGKEIQDAKNHQAARGDSVGPVEDQDDVPPVPRPD